METGIESTRPERASAAKETQPGDNETKAPTLPNDPLSIILRQEGHPNLKEALEEARKEKRDDATFAEGVVTFLTRALAERNYDNSFDCYVKSLSRLMKHGHAVRFLACALGAAGEAQTQVLRHMVYCADGDYPEPVTTALRQIVRDAAREPWSGKVEPLAKKGHAPSRPHEANAVAAMVILMQKPRASALSDAISMLDTHLERDQKIVHIAHGLNVEYCRLQRALSGVDAETRSRDPARLDDVMRKSLLAHTEDLWSSAPMNAVAYLCRFPTAENMSALKGALSLGCDWASSSAEIYNPVAAEVLKIGGVESLVALYQSRKDFYWWTRTVAEMPRPISNFRRMEAIKKLETALSNDSVLDDRARNINRLMVYCQNIAPSNFVRAALRELAKTNDETVVKWICALTSEEIAVREPQAVAAACEALSLSNHPLAEQTLYRVADREIENSSAIRWAVEKAVHEMQERKMREADAGKSR